MIADDRFPRKTKTYALNLSASWRMFLKKLGSLFDHNTWHKIPKHSCRHEFSNEGKEADLLLKTDHTLNANKNNKIPAVESGSAKAEANQTDQIATSKISLNHRNSCNKVKLIDDEVPLIQF